MSDRDRKLPVVAYDDIWDQERRVYRIGNLEWPSPRGLSMYSVLYFIVAAGLVVMVVPLVPGISNIFGLIPWYIKLPVTLGAALILSVIEIEGLRFHRLFPVVLRYWFQSKHLAGFTPCAPVGSQWRPEDITLLPDGSGPTLPALRITGPTQIIRTRAARVKSWQPGLLDSILNRPLKLYEDLGQSRSPRLITLKEGQTVTFSPGKVGAS